MDFIYNGINSKDYKLKVLTVKRYNPPERKVEIIEIPGRHGGLIQDEKVYRNRIIEVECAILGQVNILAPFISEWLYKDFNFKKLYFSDDMQKYFKGMCVNSLDFEEVLTKYGTCKIIFECDPFAYLETGDNLTTLINHKTIVNPGTCKSCPYIKIYGNGDITLNVNNENVKLLNVNGYIEIDSEEQECFKDTEECNNKFIGDFPCFETGENVVSWTGNVTKVEVIPRWRCL